MRSNDLKTNPKLDEAFTKIQKQIDQIPTPNSFSIIYDFAKRFQNKFGFGAQYIEKIYLLGYIKGKQE